MTLETSPGTTDGDPNHEQGIGSERAGTGG